jgi:uncharacterized protein (TIGR00730 family)
MKRIITIFGSSIPVEGDEEYNSAYQIGKLFAQAGFDICNGGNFGTMEAAAKGAVEYGGKATGITIDSFVALPNQYISNEVRCRSLFERIEKLITLGDAFVILQGGTGTLLEMAVVWEFINKGLMENKPIACHSSLWTNIVGLMEEQILKEKRQTGLIKCFKDPILLVEHIINQLNY